MNFSISRPTFFQRMVQRLAMTQLGSRLFAPIAHRLDGVILALSGERHTAVTASAGWHRL